MNCDEVALASAYEGLAYKSMQILVCGTTPMAFTGVHLEKGMRRNMKYACCTEFEIGFVTLREQDGMLVELRFGNHAPSDGEPQDTPLLKEARRQLTEYFAGLRKQFELPLAMEGTPFQKQVWAALREIPYGETRSYLQIAQAVGNPQACRAVGMANHVNPIGIIVPCHRVVGANGKLTGYAGGLTVKKHLLDLESRYR